MNHRKAFQPALVVVLCVGTVSITKAAPASPLAVTERCAGNGSGTGSNMHLNCTGTCENCHEEISGVVPGQIAYCSCGQSDQNTCCHLIIKNPGTSGASRDTAGTCPECGTQGECSPGGTVNNKQAICQLSDPG